MCFETEYHIPTLICCEDIVIWTHRQQQAIYVGKKVFQLSIFSGIDDNPQSQSNCCQAKTEYHDDEKPFEIKKTYIIYSSLT